jgi:hypothetical protein
VNWRRSGARAAIALGFFVLALVSVGCPKQLGGDVYGKVTLNGKPLPSGVVTFDFGKNERVGASINDDGTYRVVRPPRGTAQVTVEALTILAPLAPAAPNKGPELKGGKDFQDEINKLGPAKMPEIVPVPEKYKDANTSGLTVKIGGSSQEFNIELVGEAKK